MADPTVPVAAPSPAPAPSQDPAVAAPPPAAAPIAAPAVSSPVPAAPAVEPSSAPQPTPAPAEKPPTPEPAPAATPEPTKPEAEKPSSLLAEAATKAEPQKPEAGKEGEAAKPPVAEVPLPKYEALKLPEGVKFDDNRIGDFDSLVGKFENATHADHAAVQAFRQELADFYVKEAQAANARMAELQRDQWSRTREAWKDEFRKDPAIGGNRQETTIARCGQMLEAYGAAVGMDRKAALIQAFGVTGMGDHPEMIRFVNWAASKKTESAVPIAATTPKRPAAPSRAQRRYNGSIPQ